MYQLQGRINNQIMGVKGFVMSTQEMQVVPKTIYFLEDKGSY